MVKVRLPATCGTRSSPVRRATKAASRFVVSRSMGNFSKNLSP
ncbi:Flavoprotein WrbA [Caballeronia sordidicola]|uniref:Flavoprotein WrbA n=1 Tax=Caballeronia sordidicola TaxID=196367 RepID=A0A226XC40_CABSO|nr:Flavoprotein WrbA [Caballeronia sordidicola]